MTSPSYLSQRERRDFENLSKMALLLGTIVGLILGFFIGCLASHKLPDAETTAAKVELSP